MTRILGASIGWKLEIRSSKAQTNSKHEHRDIGTTEIARIRVRRTVGRLSLAVGGLDFVRGTASFRLPFLAEGPNHRVKCPGRARFVGDTPTMVSDVRRLAEKVVGLVGKPFPCPSQIDHRINCHISHMNSIRPQPTRHRLHQNPLRGFRWGKAGKVA